MARRELRERKCGCVYYAYGPPLLCPKHLKKSREAEEKGLRKLVIEQAADLGHTLNRFTLYGEKREGKWTAFCTQCGQIAIVYDDPPPVGDQVAGWCLTKQCSRSELANIGVEEVEDEDDGNAERVGDPDADRASIADAGERLDL